MVSTRNQRVRFPTCGTGFDTTEQIVAGVSAGFPLRVGGWPKEGLPLAMAPGPWGGGCPAPAGALLLLLFEGLTLGGAFWIIWPRVPLPDAELVEAATAAAAKEAAAATAAEAEATQRELVTFVHFRFYLPV